MSRSYHMSVEIRDFNLKKYPWIIEAANNEWNFDDDNWYSSSEKNYISNDADGQLCGGETEEEFTMRISLAVWKANGGFCPVRVVATYLEDLPHEVHELTEKDFNDAGLNPCTSCGKLGMALELVAKGDGRLLCSDCVHEAF